MSSTIHRMWMSQHVSHHQPNPIPINNDNTALLPFAVHSWMTTRPSSHPGDDRRLPPPGRLKGTVWCHAHMASWVSLTAHTTPPNAPLLAHLASAHGTPCGSPLQCAQHHLMCPHWLASCMHTWHTWCPYRSVQHCHHQSLWLSKSITMILHPCKLVWEVGNMPQISPWGDTKVTVLISLQ